MKPEAGAPLRINVIGALVDDAESHIFQPLDAIRQRQWSRKTPYLQPDAALVFFQSVMKIDAERTLVRETLDDANIAGRDSGRVSFVETFGESIAIAGEQFADLVLRIDERQRLVEPIAPGPDDRLDLLLEHSSLHYGRRTVGAADNEVDAHKRALIREKRIKGRNTSNEHAGQVSANLCADVAVVALARYVHQHRHKAIKAIATRQHAYTWAFVKLKDGQCEVVEGVFVDLE